MTAKEKAKELFDSMFINQNNGNLKSDIQFAKFRVLIMVDEILHTIENGNPIESQWIYWQEVKKQIELL